MNGLNALKDAFLKANPGLGGFVDLSRKEKSRWLLRNGLVCALPIKENRLHLTIERTAGGVEMLREEFRRRPA